MPSRGAAQQLELPGSWREQAQSVWLPQQRRGLVLRTLAINPTTRNTVGSRAHTQLSLQQVDSSLRTRLTDSIRLNGWYTPLLAATGTRHALFRLRREGTDSMVTFVTNDQGRVLTVKRQLHSAEKDWAYLSLPHPQDGFLLANQGNRNLNLWVRYLRPDLSEAWLWNGRATRGRLLLTTYAADNQHLWLVLTDNAEHRRWATCSAICLDLATGRELTRITLDEPGRTHRYATTCALDSAGNLLVAGQAFDQPRPGLNSDGDLFVQRIQADGNRQPEQRVRLNRLLRYHLQWHSVMLRPDGGVRVVGETYTTTPRWWHHVRHVGTFIGTLHIFPINRTTLRPRGLFVADFRPSGQFGQFRTIDLPDKSRYSLPTYIPARVMAAIATNAGAMQWRGLSPDRQSFILRSPRRIVRVGFADWAPHELATASRKGSLDLWGYPLHDGPPLLTESLRHPRRTRVFFAAP